MNQKEYLAICSSCINRKLDFEHGFVCQLTGRFADYKGTCKHYSLDQTVSDTIKVRTKDRPFVPIFDPVPAPEQSQAKKKAVRKKTVQKKAVPRKAVPRKAVPRKAVPRKVVQHKVKEEKERKIKPSDVALKKVRRYQSFLYALIGGLLIAAAASLGWAFVTAMTGYQEVYMALGVGLLVGIAVRFFGAGVKWVFGVLAALLAIVGSLLGYYFSQSGFPEGVQLAGILNVPDYLSPDLMLSTTQSSFVPLDLVFYGLAALLAYFLAIRRINSRKMARLDHDGYKGAPALYWLRLPLILALILLPAYYGYTLTNEDSGGLNTLYYESGTKMSEGEMRNGQKTGEWTSWHENENIMSKGFYLEGKKDSLWQRYDESGVLTSEGSFADDLKNGLWKHFYENGKLKYSMNYKAGKLHGEKTLLSSSGDVVNTEYYEEGILIEKAGVPDPAP